MDFLGENKTPRDPMERTERAADDIELLKQACFDFAMRVLKGENVHPQETAILPEVLKYLDKKSGDNTFVKYREFNEGLWETQRYWIRELKNEATVNWILHGLEAVAISLLVLKVLTR